MESKAFCMSIVTITDLFLSRNPSLHSDNLRHSAMSASEAVLLRGIILCLSEKCCILLRIIIA